MFQCPISGYSHFYVAKMMMMAVSIVSMPYLGLFPFLPDAITLEGQLIPCFNALSRAIPISTYTLLYKFLTKSAV